MTPRPPLATPAYELARRIVAKIVYDCNDRRGFHLNSLPSDIRFRMTRKWKELVAGEVEALVRERDAEKRRADVAEARVEYRDAMDDWNKMPSRIRYDDVTRASLHRFKAAVARLNALGVSP